MDKNNLRQDFINASGLHAQIRMLLDQLKSSYPKAPDNIYMPEAELAQWVAKITHGACRDMRVPQVLHPQIVENVTAKIFQMRHQYQGACKLSLWIYMIARNHCISIKRYHE